MDACFVVLDAVSFSEKSFFLIVPNLNNFVLGYGYTVRNECYQFEFC